MPLSNPMWPTDRISQNAVFDAINGGIILVDEDERIAGWNAWMVSASGLSSADVEGKLLTEVFVTADSTRLISAIRAALLSNASTILTHSINRSLLSLTTRAGQPMLHDIAIAPVAHPSGAACLMFVTDVTMSARREKYLRDQQDARYNSVVESAPDVIITIDERGVIQLANPAAVSHFGYSSAELVGKEAATLFDTQRDWISVWDAAIQGDSFVRPTELVATRKDGSKSYLEASASRWMIGARVFVTAILRDVNERRAIDAALRASEEKARSAAEALADLNQTLEQRVSDRTAQLMKVEETLRQSQKMEAIGQLTGGIAHDFNNLLLGITGALHLIEKRIAAGRISEVERFITSARESANRAASLTHRLLAFARQQPVDPRPVEVNQLIMSVEELLRRTIGETFELKFVLSKDLWLTRCDANQLENVIINLAINARDAMPRGGAVCIETSNEVINAAEAKLRTVKPGEYVRLIVRDTGEGMPPEIQARIFDPFFTTKPIGKGTGLGLSMVYGFVRQSDGSVTVQSEVNKGTAIEICLPRFYGDLDVHPTTTAGTDDNERTGSDEVVLVVEDEAVVRLLVVEVLKELGYLALEAENANSAMRILQSSQRIDLLIADLGLPDINGRTLADTALKTRKGLKVLFMTGYAEKAASSSFLQKGMQIIAKPFSMDTLSARIRDIIEES